ncbi:MAG: hypothetical protein KAX49_01665 [Halanaerobiales bacterium]|nr:hypothetical protein [Halanaerobiales bacterium]
MKYLKKSKVGLLKQVKVEGLAQLKRYTASERFRGKKILKSALIIFIGKDEYMVISC